MHNLEVAGASPAPATEEPPQGGFSVSGSESVGHSRVRSCNVVPPPQQHCDAEDPFPAYRPGRRQASKAQKAGTVPTGIKRPKNTKAATKVAALVLSDYFSRVIFLSLRTIFPRSCSSSLRFSSLSIPSRRCFGAYPHPRILTFLVPDILIQHY